MICVCKLPLCLIHHQKEYHSCPSLGNSRVNVETTERIQVDKLPDRL